MNRSARKRFGQNFLHDRGIIDRIVRVIAPKPGDLLVEIGPGRGALTEPLAGTGCDLHLVELDRDLAAELERGVATRPNVTLHQADALKADFAAITGGRRFRLAGNLPYNISTPLIFHVLEWSAAIVDMHFMLQKEVVERMAAEPGSKAWGRLSVMCQYRCAVRRLFDVPPEAFVPRPKVRSSIVRLVPHEHAPVEVGKFDTFRLVVSQAFSMRRKTLRNSLRVLLPAEAMESAGIDPGLRPESLSLADFALLSRLLD